MKNREWSAVLVIALVGCSSEDTLGSKTGSVSGVTPPKNQTSSGSHSCSLPDPSPPSGGNGGASGTPDPTLVGTWQGFVGNEAIELVIDGGAPSGRIVFGGGYQEPPPATDGDLGYPPNLDTGFGGATQTIDRGFQYTVFDGKVEDDTVLFAVASSELWQDWCPLQTSYGWDPGAESTCSCVPNWGGSFDGPTNSCSQTDPGTNQDVDRDCQKLALCLSPWWGPCSCTASGCFANMERTLQFVLTRDGDQLNGTLVGGVVEAFMGTFEVTLTRQ